MDAKLIDNLSGEEGNYVLPFFWQQGQEELVLRTELRKIRESGIRAVCVESRTHPDFVGSGWWRDLEIIMEEAENQDMKVWIFDDSHFPTGYAAGRMKYEFPHLRNRYLRVDHIDVVGSMQGASLLVGEHILDGEELVGIVAAERLTGTEELGSLMNLNVFIRDGVLFWDVPEGHWRVFMLKLTNEGGHERLQYHLNPLEPEAVDVLLQTVYEPHYERLRHKFGNTLSGFFSDEPRFGNINSLEAIIGKTPMVLPWCTDMLTLLQQKLPGEDLITQLPLLWYNSGSRASSFRYHYMDTLTRRYATCFTKRLADWCRAKGVEYISHVIEDNNAHARLGAGVGHFYRALWDQDMSGVDVVLQQIIPGMTYDFRIALGAGDGEFYHYGLAKMASSLGHLDAKKKGRTICEIFGAYGWVEGLKLMKWLTDHMLVRGVNHFIPHAFSPKAFPDDDCPPHFYAQGNNPQYRYLKTLMEYTNRLSHLLNGGTHIASAAVMYHAEAEWSGEAQLFQRPVRQLLERQIDCDVVPADLLQDRMIISDQQLIINEERFHYLIIPYAEALPSQLLHSLYEAMQEGLTIYFVENLPVRSSDGVDVHSVLKSMAEHENQYTVPLELLVEQIQQRFTSYLKMDKFQPDLRVYLYQRQNARFLMMFNEHPYDAIHDQVNINLNGVVYEYDAFDNEVRKYPSDVTEHGCRILLHLEPYESKVFLWDESLDDLKWSLSPRPRHETAVNQTIVAEWKVSTAEANQYPHFKPYCTLPKLINLAVPEHLPRFSGTFRYETMIAFENFAGTVVLDLGAAYETVELWINGHHAGIRICPPYLFEVTSFLQAGSNVVVVEVTNTLVKQVRDRFSIYRQQEPSGLIGPVILRHSKVLKTSDVND
ncbi:glycoside hydrolase family 2 sugar binding [Paenibacillus algicola]|uniref:Glycoside hydrolase family 2 sugar binding n=1 Tax=Paenibacillus algicola TaxID=2565926 RepID=A0A4P8XMK2_9BACL|nr:glycosyl hydrolase [Paenibacillus algicola]QCT04047.1 glycoside hydrolase family 2 sugar binding [Paenibacillus algicola]